MDEKNKWLQQTNFGYLIYLFCFRKQNIAIPTKMIKAMTRAALKIPIVG